MQNADPGIAFRFRAKAQIIIVVSLISFIASAVPGQTTNEADIDLSVKPGDDFYRYVNGGWLKRMVVLPAGSSSYDNRAVLTEKTSQRVRKLVEDASASHPAKNSVAQKVGDYYASFMDEEGIETKGLGPVAGEMETISAISNRKLLSAYLGTSLNTEADGLTSNADHVFGLWVNQGFEDSKHNLPHILQGGLGMPDRDNYLDRSAKASDLRTKYQAHIAAVLKFVGVADSETSAANVLALEIRLAQAFAPDADAADVFKQNNPWKRADFGTKAPGIDWDAYFESAGLSAQSDSSFGSLRL